MNKTFLFTFLNLLFLSSFSQKTIPCLIKTSIGDIRIDLFAEKAPVTVANFLKYVDAQLYDGTSFFRVCTDENEKKRLVKIEVIQGGEVQEGKEFTPIQLETTQQTGIRHKNGTLSMARGTPNSATSSFFICIGNQPELDFTGKRNPDGQGFAAFGKVNKGMKIVRQIQALKNKNQYLISPVKIISVRRER